MMMALVITRWISAVIVAACTGLELAILAHHIQRGDAWGWDAFAALVFSWTLIDAQRRINSTE